MRIPWSPRRTWTVHLVFVADTPYGSVQNRSMGELPILYLDDALAWHAWLLENHAESGGVRLAIAKKGSGRRSPTYAEAVDEAHYLQSFVTRTRRSVWSQRNRELVAALIESGRMTEAGQREIDRAKEDGRWDAAYQRQSDRTLPDDLAAAIAADPDAAAFFETLTSQNRYAIVYRTTNAKRPETRARRIADFVAMLARHETIY